MSRKLRDKQAVSFLGGDNLSFLESAYETYIENTQSSSRQSLPNKISSYFSTFVDNQSSGKVLHSHVKAQFLHLMRHSRGNNGQATTHLPQVITIDQNAILHLRKQNDVIRLIGAYRQLGHKKAKLNPLVDAMSHTIPTELTLRHYNLSESNLDDYFQIPGFNNNEPLSLREIIARMEEYYCGHIGYEYKYIPNTEVVEWLQSCIETSYNAIKMDIKKGIFAAITAAEGLERYLHTRYTGQKRFSLEGGDAFLVAIQAMIEEASIEDAKEIVMGMAHRGRLNVLVNVMGKHPESLFDEFEGKKRDQLKTFEFSGDVKYHQGFSSDVQFGDAKVHLALAFNPSHLEIVSPVVEGSVRARQTLYDDASGDKVIPLVIHGDAAFAGQGVNMETFNMNQTRGYSTKGTIHFVINNQIGFTTSNFRDARSTDYCTDVAKMVNAPIIHVNGDDPEAVYRVSKMAVAFRQKFHQDIIIDMVCYRRYGHNEADEPAVTQPMMYKKIRALPTLRQLYGDRLVREGIISDDEKDVMLQTYFDKLDNNACVALNIAEKTIPEVIARHNRWESYTQTWKSKVNTRFPILKLKAIGKKISTIPNDVIMHSRVKKVFSDRFLMASGNKPIDWGFAENLSYATLLHDGYSVRISGQDSGRGTFFHRHAVIHNQETGDAYVPLRHLENTHDTNFLVIDSLLSEEAVLAFEYGYATTDPNSLVVWEAQFGDFANGAQVVIDQFISSGELKWKRFCGLVMFLPHGYEGQGPEHSSARLERYLQLCAEWNMVVAAPTTPAQLFHLLRSQMIRKMRKPLIVMSPKSMLRHPEVTSELHELARGTFQHILDDPIYANDDSVHTQIATLILCSGKVFYELSARRNELQITHLAIARVEQIYPFAVDTVKRLLTRKYTQVKRIIWCQEEPKNQGAWRYVRHKIEESMSSTQQLQCIGRQGSASTAVGDVGLHVIQQKRLINEALGVTDIDN